MGKGGLHRFHPMSSTAISVAAQRAVSMVKLVLAAPLIETQPDAATLVDARTRIFQGAAVWRGRRRNRHRSGRLHPAWSHAALGHAARARAGHAHAPATAEAPALS